MAEMYIRIAYYLAIAFRAKVAILAKAL